MGGGEREGEARPRAAIYVNPTIHRLIANLSSQHFQCVLACIPYPHRVTKNALIGAFKNPHRGNELPDQNHRIMFGTY